MRLGRKGKASASRGGRIGAARDGATAHPKRQVTTNVELGQNTGTDGLPGRAGYPSCPRTEELPTFFHTRRPDGKTEPVRQRKKSFG